MCSEGFKDELDGIRRKDASVDPFTWDIICLWLHNQTEFGLGLRPSEDGNMRIVQGLDGVDSTAVKSTSGH